MTRHAHLAFMLPWLVLWGSVHAQNPGHYRPTNPAGITSIPPSSYQDGLINRTDSTALTSNMIITGNVGGGKHFRASLPYSPTHAISSELGSAYLDAFLRHSGSAERLPQFSGIHSPFYSPTGTVTRTVPGQAAVLTPSVLQRPRLSGGPGGSGLTPQLQQDFYGPGMPTTQALLASDRSLARRFVRLGTPSTLTGPGQDTLKQFLEKHALRETQGRDLPASERELGTPGPSPLEPPAEETSAESQPVATPVTADPVATLTALTPAEWADDFKAQQQAEPDDASDPSQTAIDDETDAPEIDYDWMVSPHTPPDRAAPAQSISAQYATLQAFTRAKYEHFMHRGDTHLQNRAFAKAAGAYTLADTYHPNDPAASVGKSLALLAQRQFSTSALFLARTIERRPQFAHETIDLAVHVGGQAALHLRILEARTFLKRSGSFDLHFLLAYVYTQIKDLGMAQEAIDKAIRKQPEHAAAKTLRLAIEAKLKG